MTVTTGLSGNEIYCLQLKNYQPGNIVVGNSVYSLGLVRSISTGFKTILGGELEHVTELIEEGRKTAYTRMTDEAMAHGAIGLTGVSSELIYHSGNIEFLSIGSVIHGDQQDKFTTSADGQELFAQLDAGFKPICFAFGNVAYSMGLSGSITGTLKTLKRGEIAEYSDMFNKTRHLALERIINHGKKQGANAILGIKTTIMPFLGTSEMLMIGTASKHEGLDTKDVISSDLTNIEMWNLAKLGYAPLRLLLGTSVYSLGFLGGVTSFMKSFVRGEIPELTQLIYEARENALAIINQEAKEIGADDVVGVKTYVYQLGNGLIEFLAIGTAIKKIPTIKTESANLPVQVVMWDENTFYSSSTAESVNVNIATMKPFNPLNLIVLLFFLFILFISFR